MASASPLPSSSSARGLKYDVFLSFRGSDTRKGITSELHRRLTKRGIETYMDNPNLQVGDVISPTLLAAIEGSRFAIIILSPNYASSTWCLQELTKICQCMEYNNRILPLFFNVEPDDVRLQNGSFQQALTNYDNSGLYRPEKIQEWKDALTKVANFSGWDLRNYKTERELVKKIVEDMCSKVQPIENNKGDLEETIEAKNKPHVASGVNVSSGYLSSDNLNFGKQGDVVKGVGGDFIKGVHGGVFKDVHGGVFKDVHGDFVRGDRGGDGSYFIKGVRGGVVNGVHGDFVRGDRGGDGGDNNNGDFAGVGGPAKGNNNFNRGQK